MVLQAMLESGATPEEIAKVMVEQKLLQAIGTSPGTYFFTKNLNDLEFNSFQTNTKLSMQCAV